MDVNLLAKYSAGRDESPPVKMYLHNGERYVADGPPSPTVAPGEIFLNPNGDPEVADHWHGYLDGGATRLQKLKPYTPEPPVIETSTPSSVCSMPDLTLLGGGYLSVESDVEFVLNRGHGGEWYFCSEDAPAICNWLRKSYSEKFTAEGESSDWKATALKAERKIEDIEEERDSLYGELCWVGNILSGFAAEMPGGGVIPALKTVLKRLVEAEGRLKGIDAKVKANLKRHDGTSQMEYHGDCH